LNVNVECDVATAEKNVEEKAFSLILFTVTMVAMRFVLTSDNAPIIVAVFRACHSN